jgi:hypothetical protein
MQTATVKVPSRIVGITAVSNGGGAGRVIKILDILQYHLDRSRTNLSTADGRFIAYQHAEVARTLTEVIRDLRDVGCDWS